MNWFIRVIKYHELHNLIMGNYSRMTVGELQVSMSVTHHMKNKFDKISAMKNKFDNCINIQSELLKIYHIGVWIWRWIVPKGNYEKKGHPYHHFTRQTSRTWETSYHRSLVQSSRKISSIRRTKIPKLKWFSSRPEVVFAQSFEARW